MRLIQQGLICFLCLGVIVSGNMRSDDDEDLLQHQEDIRNQVIYESESGTTYVDPSTLQPFFNKPIIPRNTRSPHNDLFLTSLQQLSETKQNEGEIEDRLSTPTTEDSAIQPEFENALKLTESSNPTDVSLGIDLLTKISERGYSVASYHLGLMYQEGLLVPRNFDTAFDYFNKSAAKGYPPAQRELAFMYDTGKGVSLDKAKALTYYAVAAKGQDIRAALVLGYKHAWGYDVQKSCSIAAMYYRDVGEYVTQKIVKMGYDNSAYVHFVNLKELQDTGELPYTQEEEIVEYMEFAAETGDPVYQIQIGLMYMYGVYGHPIDHVRAREYFEMAHVQDNPRATALLGSLFEEGQGVEPSNDTAIEYYKMAHENGNPHGTYHLGRAYLRGTGVEQNYELALKYLQEAADEIHIQATVELGKMYFYGIGVKYDYQKAARLFNTAAVHDSAEGKFYYAKMNQHGLGVPERCPVALQWYEGLATKGDWIYEFDQAIEEYLNENYDLALLYYEKLAEAGFKTAQYNAAWIYDNHLHSNEYLSPEESSSIKAFEYFKKAADQGNEDAHLRIGDYYYYGGHVNVSHALARVHYSACKGSGQALYNLAYIHQHGIGVLVDRSLAYELYQTAIHIDEGSILACTLSIISLGYDFVIEKYNDNKLTDVLPALWEFMFPNIFTEFLDALEHDLELLESELEEELRNLENEKKPSGEYSFLDEEIAGGYSLDTILIAILCITIGVVLLFRQGFIQVQVQRA